MSWATVAPANSTSSQTPTGFSARSGPSACGKQAEHHQAAMFVAAGLIYAAGHDRIAGLSGVGRALPMSVLAFGIAGASLIGLPPSGAYLAKKLLLQAATEAKQWWWAIVIQAGGGLHEQLRGAGARARTGARERAGQVARRRPAHAASRSDGARPLRSLSLGLISWQAYLSLSPIRRQSGDARNAGDGALADLGRRRAGDPAGALGISIRARSPRECRRRSDRPRQTHGPCLGRGNRANRWHVSAMAGGDVSLLAVAIMFGVAMPAGR
jgi:hypothetical protein